MSPPPPEETRELSTGPRELVFRRFRLQVTRGPDAGLERLSDQSELVIGTAASNQLVLSDPTVSRHHCAITASPRGFLLRDLGSTNGTTLAGYEIESAYLKPGAVIGMGETTLRFDSLSEEIREPLSAEEGYGRALGRSSAMRRIFALLPRIAASDSTVLLEGETGTGKGLLAEAIHASGPRARGPFMVVDCSAIPPTLIESELFGHERGSFTGADRVRVGAFEAAAGGTVFLDEIGELPIDMQPKLLRVLEDRVVKRVGGVQPIRLDVRVVAATNRALHQEVNRGTFRSDLFYRLNIVRLRIPPLRERREDIPLLVGHFYEQFAREHLGPPPELLSALATQDWPGNVRELRSAVERAVLLRDPLLWREGGVAAADGATSESSDFADGVSFRAAKERVVSRWESAYISELIRRNGGNLSAAARAARMDRNYLRELLRRHELQVKDE